MMGANYPQGKSLKILVGKFSKQQLHLLSFASKWLCLRRPEQQSSQKDANNVTKKPGKKSTSHIIVHHQIPGVPTSFGQKSTKNKRQKNREMKVCLHSRYVAPFNLTNFSFEILKLCWDTRYFHAYFSFIYYSNIAVAVGFFQNSGTPEQHFQCINTMTITERERDDFSQQHQEHFYYDAMYCLSGVKMALVTLLLLLCPVTCNGTCWASLTCCSIATD